jgi:cytochrome c-type biogenesis protein CcmH/NrfF
MKLLYEKYKPKALFPLLTFLVLIGLLWRGMALDPKIRPSPLIGQPRPSSLLQIERQKNYLFEDQATEKLFSRITKELRCIVCQNQTLADSAAPLAVDLKDEIYQRVRMGAGKEEVMAYVTSRYGDFISYAPPFKLETVLLWLGPLLMLVLGLMSLRKYLK